MTDGANRAKGAKFGGKKARFSNPKLFTPTAMSVALASAGAIPAPHIIDQPTYAFTGVRPQTLHLLTV